MKRLIFVFAFIALVASCSKDYEQMPEQAPERVRVTINLVPETKAALPGDSDKKFNNTQVFAFDDQGFLETCSELESGTFQISLDLLPGAKTIWAVMNLGSAIAPDTLTEFLAMRKRLEQNTTANMIMSASSSIVVTDCALEISLAFKRLASKVVIEKITRNFSNSKYAGIPLTIKRIYMSNVAADCGFAADGSVSSWYNKLGEIDPDLPAAASALTVDSGLSYSLAQGASYENVHAFYVFPNNSTDDTQGSSWTARRTRLVVECDYNGRPCYYPINIPSGSGVLERNKEYRITELILRRPGSNYPDVRDDEVLSSFWCCDNISISEWDTGTSGSQTFN